MLDRPSHALLFAVLPVLFLYAHNASKLSPRDLAMVLPATVLAAGIVFLLFRLLLRDGRRAGLAATVFWLWFFSWGPLRHGEALLGSGAIGAEWLLAALWSGVLLVVLWGMSRLRQDLRPATRLLNVVSLGLVLLQVAMAGPTVWRQAHRQYPVPDLAGYRSHRPAGGKLPNIYFIVLDGYARGDVLRERYGFDNGPFLDFLRQRGFYVADRSSANYYTTLMSLPATLNMDYLDPLARAAGKHCSDVKPAVAYVEHNRVGRLLRAAGYRTIANYCGWSDWEMSSADLFQGRPVLGNFERQVLEWTPRAALGSHDELTAHRWRIRHPLEHLADTEKLPGPVFAFIHVLCPHPPFVFLPDGRPRPAAQPFLDELNCSAALPRHLWERRYREQVQGLNMMVERAVDEVLAVADPDTIIIIQGDHGPPTDADRWEIMSILNAIRLPGGGAGLKPDISPVNTFRLVLNRVLDTRLPLLPDKHYYVFIWQPYVFEPVADRELWGPPEPRGTRKQTLPVVPSSR